MEGDEKVKTTQIFPAILIILDLGAALVWGLDSGDREITRYATVKELECVRKILNGDGK